jgi:hypothetical protein
MGKEELWLAKSLLVKNSWLEPVVLKLLARMHRYWYGIGYGTGTGTEVHHFLKKLGYDTWGVRRLIN